MHLARVTERRRLDAKIALSERQKTAAGAPGKRGRRSSDSPHERR